MFGAGLESVLDLARATGRSSACTSAIATAITAATAAAIGSISSTGATTVTGSGCGTTVSSDSAFSSSYLSLPLQLQIQFVEQLLAALTSLALTALVLVTLALLSLIGLSRRSVLQSICSSLHGCATDGAGSQGEAVAITGWAVLRTDSGRVYARTVKEVLVLCTVRLR